MANSRRRRGRTQTERPPRRRTNSDTRNESVGRPVIRNRMVAAFLVILGLFAVLTFRIGWIQIVQNQVYESKAAEYQTKDVTIPATRGSILDRNGNELAVSSTTYRIWVRLKALDPTNPAEQPEVNREEPIAASIIGKAIGKSQAAIEAMYKTDAARVRVATDIPKAEMEKIRSGINENNLQIVEIETVDSRKYPLGTLASTIIGSTNYDGSGQSGVEFQYNRYLAGIAGRSVSSTDANGQVLPGGEKEDYASQNGLSVKLTIDETIQYYVEQALQEGKQQMNADRMMAIVMDPNNGDILAMASTDDANFNPNDPGEPVDPTARAAFMKLSAQDQSAYLSKMWHNELIGDLYDPGSVFKLVTVSSALEAGAVTPESTFVCNGGIQVADQYIRCWVYPGAHGTEDLKTAVKNSCNPAMIQVVQRLGYEKFYNYLQLYGITAKTGIDLPGEASPLIQDEQTAIPVGLATMAFGQGLSITPMQMIDAVATIANNGKLMQPRIAEGLVDDNGKTVQTFPSKIVRQVISEETAKQTRDIMDYVAVQEGVTGGDLSGYTIGIKTGTTEQLVNGKYTDSQRIGSLVAIAPIENPRFVILVLCDTPRNGFYGITTTGPTLEKITGETLRYLNVKPSYTQAEINSMESGKIQVPDYTGMAYNDAAAKIKALGLVASGQDEDSPDNFKVVDQYPKPGMRANAGDTVFLYAA
ncbi:MAG: penicillin-binding transpeptidase domain-containing protein [Clostridiales bacterium]|nr:penicillin-binding transpeptidase domain-containing protein [Clostridiales bacterium]